MSEHFIPLFHLAQRWHLQDPHYNPLIWPFILVPGLQCSCPARLMMQKKSQKTEDLTPLFEASHKSLFLKWLVSLNIISVNCLAVVFQTLFILVCESISPLSLVLVTGIPKTAKIYEDLSNLGTTPGGKLLNPPISFEEESKVLTSSFSGSGSVTYVKF